MQSLLQFDQKCNQGFFYLRSRGPGSRGRCRHPCRSCRGRMWGRRCRWFCTRRRTPWFEQIPWPKDIKKSALSMDFFVRFLIRCVVREKKCSKRNLGQNEVLSSCFLDPLILQRWGKINGHKENLDGSQSHHIEDPHFLHVLEKDIGERKIAFQTSAAVERSEIFQFRV